MSGFAQIGQRAHVGARFDVDRQSRERRRSRLAQFGRRYRRIQSDCCVYCGGAVQVFDHVPPLSCAAQYVEGDPHALYPACGECNAILGPLDVVCLVERAAVVYERRAVRIADTVRVYETKRSQRVFKAAPQSHFEAVRDMADALRWMASPDAQYWRRAVCVCDHCTGFAG